VIGPAIYVGTLRHRRFRPRPHAFTYQIFMVLVDVDRIDEQMRVSAFTSVNRFNWASFNDRDHLGDPTQPLRARVAANAAEHGVVLPDGPLFLLTHLSYLGYAFNPISFYYCCDANGRVASVLCEVNSTFGEQCTYWLPAPGPDGPKAFRHRTPKVMHVSPFMSMNVDYEFVVTPPDATVVAHMNTIERRDTEESPYFDATLVLERRPWTARALRAQLMRHPWMSAKVIGAIHWEAFKLWLKGVPSHPHPNDVTVRSEAGREASV
jgi:DUF1365 family protein